MPIDLYSSTLKPFIIPLGFTVTATICLLMTLKKCMRGYVLCRQLSCQNFSFYFVLNLDTGPYSEDLNFYPMRHILVITMPLPILTTALNHHTYQPYILTNIINTLV